MQPYRNGCNEDGAQHTKIECLDVCDHRESSAAASFLTVVNTEEGTVKC